jgi:hypothetical protein
MDLLYFDIGFTVDIHIHIHPYRHIYIDKQIIYIYYLYILDDVAGFGHQMVVGEFFISRFGEVEWNPHENRRT